ncbi:hypothetical protein LTR56_005362 [Elasticomyces elasticus]|nr:hypothetical protein LTR56_005362 [Elasticomyces elasticus]KAK4927751.1 hypothetical protein LTR49_005374 [Elasticomyces elasticus]
MRLTSVVVALAATFMPLAVYATPANVSQPAVVECVKIKHFWYHQFAIRGQHFDSNFLDGFANPAMSGKNLKREISGCGVLSGWKFTTLVDGQFGREWEWTATGGLPKTAKSGCVARALMTIGAPKGTGCHWPKDKPPTPSDPHPPQDSGKWWGRL